jgi:hypothetical protein
LGAKRQALVELTSVDKAQSILASCHEKPLVIRGFEIAIVRAALQIIDTM